MKKQIYRKSSFPTNYIWNNKIYFTIDTVYNQKYAIYYVNSNITGEVFGEIIVIKTNTGSFEFHYSSNKDFDMDEFMKITNYCCSGQGFVVRNIYDGFDYVAENLYGHTKLKYGKEYWDE